MVKTFILQWHLSEKCNLKCLHCYQENHKPVELEFAELKNIYEQYKQLLKKLNMKGHINITGGEPLCCSSLFKILDLIKKDDITFAILTNGTLFTEKLVKKLKEYNPLYVQVSLEGGKKVNDYIRGKGTYKKIAKGIKILKDNNIYTSISFTANSVNYKEFPKVVKFAKKYKADKVWSDRYIPLGDNADLKLALNLKQTQEYLKLMKKERLKQKNNKPLISMDRALQFLMTKDFPYHCTAGDTLLTVMENGDLVPCRRMPIFIGNLKENNMYDLYMNSEILVKLRNDNIPDDCLECEHAKICHGGLKCLTYALYKDLNHKDIGCKEE